MITIRPWKTDDLTNLVKYANNPDIAKRLTDAFPHPYTEEDGIRFIEMTNKQDPTLIFAIDLDGEAIGGIGLHPRQDIDRLNAELGYWLAEPYWGRGIISEVIPMMVKKGFEILQIERIYARPFGSNMASQRVLEKSGFRLEARFDKVLIKNNVLEDELIYAIRRKKLPF